MITVSHLLPDIKGSSTWTEWMNYWVNEQIDAHVQVPKQGKAGVDRRHLNAILYTICLSYLLSSTFYLGLLMAIILCGQSKHLVIPIQIFKFSQVPYLNSPLKFNNKKPKSKSWFYLLSLFLSSHSSSYQVTFLSFLYLSLKWLSPISSQ